MTNALLASPTRTDCLFAPQAPSSRAISLAARQSLVEGLAHLQAGDAATAVTVLSRALDHAPEFTEAHVFLGIAQALTSNIYPALDHLERATEIEPDSFAAHFALAQLNFKLRVPEKGFAEAEAALRCPMTLEQRRMLTQLLKDERERERNGIARPRFDRPFGRLALALGGAGMIAAVLGVLARLI